MHKFFCSYNNLTERYELTKSQSVLLNPKINTQAKQTILTEIQTSIQQLYSIIVILKENEQLEKRLDILDETELLISNLHYSIFSSPIELTTQKNHTDERTIDDAINIVSSIEKDININEYNRITAIIKNNLLQIKTTN